MTSSRCITILVACCLLALASACAQQPPVFPKVTLTGLDRNGLRTVTTELLRTYSPGGKYIIDRCNQAPAAYTFDSGTVKMGACPDYLQWVRKRTMDGVIADLCIAVHEMLHDYQFRIAYATLAEKKLSPKGALYHAFYTGDETILVRQTRVYPTSEMQGLFPAALRTTRFPVYVFPARNTGAHIDGVYGLLDEFNAYYLTTKTGMDFLPYYQYSVEGTPDNWFAFFDCMNRHYFAYAEFKLYILNYLRYAREHHPDVYAGIMANAEFKHAFVTIEARYARAVADYFAAKEQIFSQLRAAGYEVEEDDEFTRIIEQDGSYTGRSNFLRTYNTLMQELAKPEHQRMMEELREP